MVITIGENIRRLRRSKNITQEQLAEVLNISITAVSKWERNETYPDITLLFPLAHFFGVSLDELMGYNAERVESDICDAIEKYRQLKRVDFLESQKFIIEVYKKYPNDYRIMTNYMWNIGGDYADNDHKVLLNNKDEFLKICDCILEGCKDVHMRLDAYNMMGKILHAEGKTEDALKLYSKEFPDWYMTTGQKSEQLFAKDTPEFNRQLLLNMYELTDFAANKKVKEIWFCKNYSIKDKVVKGLVLLNAIDNLRNATESDELYLTLYHISSDMLGKLKYYNACEEDITEYEKRRETYADICNNLAENNDIIKEYILKVYQRERL